MRILYNAKVVVKLLMAFLILIGLMIAVGVFGIRATRIISDSNTHIYENNFKSTVAIQNINNALSEMSLTLQRVVLSDFLKERNDNVKKMEEYAKYIDSQAKIYENGIIEDEDKQLFNAYKAAMTNYTNEEVKAIDLAMGGTYEDATDYNQEKVRPLADAVQDEIDKLIAFNTKDVQENVDEASQEYLSTRSGIIWVMVFSAAFALIIGVVISQVITGPLKEVIRVSNKISQGDLTDEIKPKYLKYKDEIAAVAKNIEGMKQGLLATVSGIKASSDDLGEQVRSTNVTLTDLGEGISDTSAAAEQLSASMEETSASAEEMNATATEIGNAVDMVATMATEGANKAGEINSRASELGTSVKQSINKSDQVFNEIRANLEKALEESKAVNEINALADAILGITSQTNLLALNASIEAARAGEAGKGFAVVANEIGTLAEGSKNTVNEIQSITKVVMSAVGNLSSSANSLLKFVAEDVNKDYKDMLSAADAYNTDAVYINDMTTDLSATAQQLSASVQAMMDAINEVSTSAQEGAKTTASVASQASEISDNANTIVSNMQNTDQTASELVDLVDRFKI